MLCILSYIIHVHSALLKIKFNTRRIDQIKCLRWICFILGWIRYVKEKVLIYLNILSKTCCSVQQWLWSHEQFLTPPEEGDWSTWQHELALLTETVTRVCMHALKHSTWTWWPYVHSVLSAYSFKGAVFLFESAESVLCAWICCQTQPQPFIWLMFALSSPIQQRYLVWGEFLVPFR